VSQSGYWLIKRAMVAVVIAAAFASFFLQAASFATLLLQLSPPIIVGVMAGRWPEPVRDWPTLISQDFSARPKDVIETIAIVVGGLAGLAAGLWAWSSLAATLGLLGALLGTYVFVIVALGIAFLTEGAIGLLERWRWRSSDPRAEAGRDSPPPGSEQ
jgi:hypothetical protein